MRLNKPQDTAGVSAQSRLRTTIVSTFIIMCTATLSAFGEAYEWQFFTELKYGRQQQASTWIGSGRVLVTGGRINGIGQLNGTPTTSCEIIDFRAASSFEVAGMNVPRAEHSILVDTRDSTVIVLCGVIQPGGGSDYPQITNTIERYDREKDEWTIIGSTLVARRQQCAYWLNGDEIMIVGGRYQNLTSMDDAEIFNVSTGQSRLVASFPTNISTAMAISSGKFDGVVVGGREGGANSAKSPKGYRYDPLTNTWDLLIDLGVKTARPTALGLWEGGALLSGGAFEESPFDALNTIWIQSDLNQIDEIGNMVDGRQWHGMAQLNSDTVITGGGYADNAKIVNTCDWVDVSTGFANQGPRLNIGRSYHEFIAIPASFRQSGVPREANVLCIAGLRSDGALEPRVEILVRTCTGTQDLLSENVFKNLRGSAIIKDHELHLTESLTFQAGAAWVQRKVQVVPEADFRFTFRMHDGTDNALNDGGAQGADGICLVLQNQVPSGVGEPGQGIGYDQLVHGVAIEFDSYMNAAFSDPNTSHVAVQVGNGLKMRPVHQPPYLKALETKGVPEFVADGRDYYARVLFTLDRVRVWISDEQVLGQPVIDIPFDLSAELNIKGEGRTWVGLTSATGFSQESHIVSAWTLGNCDPVISKVEEEAGSAPAHFTIAPNPSMNLATVSFVEAATFTRHIQVVDLQGNIVHSMESSEKNVYLPAAALPAGSYLVVVNDAQGTFSQLWNIKR